MIVVICNLIVLCLMLMGVTAGFAIYFYSEYQKSKRARGDRNYEE